MDNLPDTYTKKRGFAKLPKEEVSRIARKGGKAAHQKGKAHVFTSEEAKVAGRKGGLARHQNRVAVSLDQ